MHVVTSDDLPTPAPTEPVSTEPTSAPEVNPDEQTAKPEESSEAPKPRKPVQPRINELVAERNQERARRLELEQRLQALENPPKVAEKPKPDQFTDAFQYAEALADWTAEEKVTAALADRDQQAQRRQHEAVVQQTVNTWNERQGRARAAIADYDEVLESAAEIMVPQHITQAIVESDLGPQVAYHLAKHPEEAQRLLGLSPNAAVREIGKLEVKLEKAPAVTEQSKAPPPINPLKNASSPMEKDPEKMTYQEWKEARKSGRIR